MKHDTKKEFRSSAFCRSECAVKLEVVKVGIEETDLFKSLRILQNCFDFLGLSFPKKANLALIPQIIYNLVSVAFVGNLRHSRET